MIYLMDDRKKRIGELERQMKEQAILLDSLLTGLGEALFGRIAGSSTEDVSAFGELAAYRRFQDDIAASEVAIQAVEEQIRRFKELEEGIEARELEESAFVMELALMHAGLGKLLLGVPVNAPVDETVYADFCAPYRDQAEALQTKVDSLEERLATLEQREGGNVFTWIGKSAQGLVLRSFLTKAEENLEQLRRNVGERYSRDFAGLSGDRELISLSAGTMEILSLCSEIEQKREEQQALLQDLEILREEKKKISGSYSAGGSPQKQIQSIKNRVAAVHLELKALYRRAGAEAANIGELAGDLLSERRQIINDMITAESQETLDTAVRIDNSIHDAESQIKKLRASLAIDDEKAKIEKYRRMIRDRKDKIAQAEKSIAEFEKGIKDSEANIEELQALL